MVLQASEEIRIWGWGEPGECVNLTLAGQSRTCCVDQEGDWEISLGPVDPGGPHELIVSASNEIRVKDILVGEVWVCAGQSNMAFPLEGSLHGESEIQKSEFPEIRLFRVNRKMATKPLRELQGRWEKCSPDTARIFSAVAYHFGKEIHETQHTPVGLILSCWGGTPAEAWTEESYLRAIPAQLEAIQEWESEIAAFETQGGAEDGPSNFIEDPRLSNWRPATLFNGMVAPLIPFSLRGVIWYQGEANARKAHEYGDLFQATISSWRTAWGGSDFPFLFVQLPNWGEVDDEPGESDWAELREAQSKSLELPNTEMAVTLDLGEADDVHPKKKREVGHRLALLARAQVYNETLSALSPRFKSASFQNGKAEITFRDVGEGLEISDNETLLGFAIAGDNRVFYYANANLSENRVTVWSDNVPDPVAVRYAWDHNPLFNLYGINGLPVAPFRTDTWPGRTQDTFSNLIHSLKSKAIRRFGD